MNSATSYEYVFGLIGTDVVILMQEIGLCEYWKYRKIKENEKAENSF